MLTDGADFISSGSKFHNFGIIYYYIEYYSIN